MRNFEGEPPFVPDVRGGDLTPIRNAGAMIGYRAMALAPSRRR